MAGKKKKKPFRAFWIFFWFQFLVLVAMVGLVGYYYIGGYSDEVKELHAQALAIAQKSLPSDFKTAQTSVCYDANGEIISTLKGEKDVYYLTYDEIPIMVQNAVVSTEDKKFFEHKGYDLKGIARAVYAMYRDREVKQGGSTITQQLAKNIYLTSERTWQRKVEEIYLAVELERKYTKSQILEFYINNCYYANGYYGICAASQGYFQKEPEKLTLSEAAFLCAIPNSPATYDPLVNKENTISRRNLILGEMLEENKISVIAYTMALDEDIVIRHSRRERQNYIETYTYYCATRALMEKDGFTFRYSFTGDKDRSAYDEDYSQAYGSAQQKLFTGGYRIYTSLDPTVQRILQESVDRGLEEFTETNDEGVFALQSAAACIDNGTGLVIAAVGGRSQELEGYTLNRAYQAFRQPGSSIKPLIVYTPALERGYTPKTMISTERLPEDYEEDPFEEKEPGPELDIGTAVAVSNNAVAWNVFKSLTPGVGLGYLVDMEFSKIDPEDYRLPSALGGFTTGVSPVEMASGYAAIENDGMFRSPTCIKRITDAAGNVIYEHDDAGRHVYDMNATRTMTDMLVNVMTEGTGRELALETMPCAGKTGTTNSNKDGWFVGFTRYYTTSVWVGYDMPRELENLKGATYPGSIWKDFMDQLHEGLSAIDFKTPYEGDQLHVPRDYDRDEDAYVTEERYMEEDPPEDQTLQTTDMMPTEEPFPEGQPQDIPLDMPEPGGFETE